MKFYNIPLALWTLFNRVSVAMLVSACTGVPSGQVEQTVWLVHEKLGSDGACSCLLAEQFEDQISAAPLRADLAVQTALYCNPRISEALEEIGIAQADLWEAGLLSNPIVGGFIRYPNKKNFAINSEISVVQAFLDALLIPLKRKVAAADLSKTQWEMAHRILSLAFEVEEAFLEWAAACRRLDDEKMQLELTEIALELAEAQQKAGNIQNLQRQDRFSGFLEKLASYAKAEQEAILRRGQLAKLMGVQLCPGVSCAPLPDVPRCAEDFCGLEEVALRERLDLQAARWELHSLYLSMNLTAPWVYTEAEGGLSVEREIEGPYVTGPQISLRLPLFNWGQAATARLQAEIRKRQAALVALENEILVEIQSAKELLTITHERINLYKDQILPNQSRLVVATEQLYNVMGASIYELLDSKRKQLQAYMDYQEALKEYWLFRLKLCRAVGQKISCQRGDDFE